MPRAKKSGLHCQTYLDPRILAALHRYVVKKGATPRSMGNLLRMLLEGLHTNLAKSGHLTPETSMKDAVAYLQAQDIIKGQLLDINRRGAGEILQEIMLEDTDIPTQQEEAPASIESAAERLRNMLGEQ